MTVHHNSQSVCSRYTIEPDMAPEVCTHIIQSISNHISAPKGASHA